jgi:N-ethylmaleimide reductase
VAPSAIAIPHGHAHTAEGPKPYSTPRALETREIAGIVEQFTDGARRAKAAGFDGVEIHGANGYIIDEFLRDGTNKRTDRYGGSVENRARFLLEIVEGVSSIWGADRVGVRVSPLNTYHDMSDSNPKETFGHVATELAARRIGYLHVLEAISGMLFVPGGPIAPHLRERFRGVVIVNGGYTVDSANEALRTGLADLISFGAPFLANPDLPERLARRAPLNAPDVSTFYTPDARGYTDYPRLDDAPQTVAGA